MVIGGMPEAADRADRDRDRGRGGGARAAQVLGSGEAAEGAFASEIAA
jgi:hypothetical protein